MGGSTGHGGAAHGSVREYVLGLMLSIILTAIPFALVMTGAFPKPVTIAVIFLCAIGQLLVQLIFFLHLNFESEQLWNTISIIFILLAVTIIIIGTLWVMGHLNHNMLLGH